MDKDPLVFVGHVLEEIRVLNSIAADHTFMSFQANAIAYRAAIYAIQTISEAVRQLPDDITGNHPQIPWHRIQAIGNHTRHEYYRLDEFVLWNIVTVELRPLEAIMISLSETKRP